MSEPVHEQEQEVVLELGDAELTGLLAVPREAVGVVVFAHGSGSSRLSERNRFVARRLRARGLGTLLMDLLTADEEAADLWTRHLRFDIPLLAGRVVGAIDWLDRERPRTGGLPVGTLGASTGAAAALIAAAERPRRVGAVVSRGGRPDLASAVLAKVRTPALFLVGSRDPAVLEVNRLAAARMSVAPRLEVVSGASHRFEEPGTLERAAEISAAFLRRHLERAAASAAATEPGW
jgi:dienelactone hydrolase